MTTFWVLAAGLMGLALLFVVPPILSRKPTGGNVDENEVNLAVFRQQLEELDADLAAGNLEQSQYESARQDLEKELLIDIDDDTAPASASDKSGRWAAGVLALAVPVMAVGLYLGLGDQTAIDRVNVMAARGTPQEQAKDLPPMEELVEKLAQRMQQNPDNLQGWVMLGRSYLAIGAHAEAGEAFEKARALAPDEPDVLLGYAEALAKAQGDMAGKPAELIAAALEIAPSNPNALWMGGLVEFQNGDPQTAITHWTKLQGLLEPGGEDASAIRKYIADAREAAGLAPEPAAEAPAAAPTMTAAQAPEPQATAPAETAGNAVQVTVSLGTDMAGRFSPDDTLFVFALALQGPPMPLAVQRLQAKDLPVTLTLDDSMAMMPQMRLSSFEQVLVGARISKSGNPKAQAGDLQGEVSPVIPGDNPQVAVVIDSIRP